MEDIILGLTSIATDLDNDGKSGAAAQVDTIAKRVLAVKTAQYVGVQGYWVRNKRCFDNCYRQKRASTPKKAAQEVWAECHKEYLSAINDDNNPWAKYAELNDANFIKTSSSIAKSSGFVKLTEQKISEGFSVGNAISASIDEEIAAPYQSLLSSASDLLDISQNIVKQNPVIAEKLNTESENLIKEAQALNRLWNTMKTPLTGLQNVWNPAALNTGQQTQMMNALNKIEQSKELYSTGLSELKQLAMTAKNQEFLAKLNQNFPPSVLNWLTKGITMTKQALQAIQGRNTGTEPGNLLQQGYQGAKNQVQKGVQNVQKGVQNVSNYLNKSPGQGFKASPWAKKNPNP